MNRFKRLLPPLLPLAALYFLTAGEEPFLPYQNGAPGGHTGSPGDGGMTCAQAGCHSSFAPITNAPNVSINTNIPAQGYVPGSSYTVSAEISMGGTTFGFELTAEDSTGQKVGDLSVLQANETQLTNGGEAITHTSNGNGGAGSRSWDMEWKAPPSAVGPVTFYAAFNEANGNGNPTGDSIELTQREIPVDSSWMAIKEFRNESPLFSVKPLPIRSSFQISQLPLESGACSLLLYDGKGRLLRTLYQGQLGKLSGKRLFLNPKPSAGLYLLELRMDERGREVEEVLLR